MIIAVKAEISDRLKVLNQCMDILQGNESETQDIMLDVASSLAELKEGLDESRKEIDTIRTQMSVVARLSSLLESYQSRLKECEASLPARTTSTKPQNQASAEIKSSEMEKMNIAPQLQFVSYITLDEYQTIPKYMKGRVQYETIKTAVDEFNAALEAKYTFLARTFANMSGLAEKKRFKQLKSQESKTLTKGVHFITADDLKDSCVLKSETSRRTLLTILRHLKKTRDIRGPGSLVRFAAA